MAAIGLLGVAAGALAYVLTPYAGLARGYERAFGPFYRQAFWTTDFFTPVVKQQGNAWCGLAAALSLAAAAWLMRARPVLPPRQSRASPPSDPIRWVVLAAAGGLWVWVNQLLPVAYDEAFSAWHTAARPAGLAWSYYMLPNNHVLHNLLNAALGGWWAPDLVLTGRLLAGAAYLATVALLYGALRRGELAVPLPPILAGLGALVIATQGPLWGFGAQNRGYALLALAHWGAALGVLAATRRPAGRGAVGCAVGCAVGYAVLPTFLYFHVAVVVFAAGSQAIRRHLDGRFWCWQAAAGLAVLLFYLPALAFSGAGAFTHNPYVEPTASSVGAFLPAALPTLPTYLDYGFPALWPDHPLGRWLLLVPALLLLAAPGVRRRAPGLTGAAGLYALALVAAVGLALLFRRLPFHRNLIGQLSLGLALLVGGAATLLGPGRTGERWSRRRAVGLAAGLLGLLGWQVVAWPALLPQQLYYTDVPTAAQTAHATLNRLLPGGRVAFSDESFYAAAFARSPARALRAALPGAPDPAADYYLSALTEAAPAWVLGAGFVRADTVAETVIWRRTW